MEIQGNMKKLDGKFIIKGKITQTKRTKIYFGCHIDNQRDDLYIKIFKNKEIKKNVFFSLIEKNVKLNNENIIKIYEGGIGNIQSLDNITNDNYYIIEEVAINGSLFDYIFYLEKGYNEEISKKIFLQILSGLKYYNENDLFINRIKCDNILIDKDYKIKISDIILDNLTPSKNIPSARNIDLASILFALVSGKDIKDKVISKKNLENFWKGVNQNLFIDFSPNFINLFNALISNEFSPDKKKLIENSEYYNNIMKHPWFNNYSINDIIGNNNHCYIDVIKELESRQNLVNQKREEEMIYNQIHENFNDAVEINIDCNRVFRSYNFDDNENKYFDDKNKCVPFYQTNKNSFNQIIINGNIDKVNFMNNLVASYEKNNVNDNCKYLVKTDDNKLKFIVIIETLNQGDDEDEDKCIKISLSKVNENKHILNIYKLFGEKSYYMSFYKNLLNKIKEIIK